MPKYNVTLPVTMAVCLTVEAENPEAAKKAAQAAEGWWVEVCPPGLPSDPQIIEMEVHEKVAYGNVYEGCINEISVEEAE